MKKLIWLLIVVSFPFIASNSAAQQEDPAEEGIYKSIFLEGGYGEAGASAAIGFRYWQLGLAVGVSGFASDIPNYAFSYGTGQVISPNQPLPSGFWEEKHEALIVAADLSYYYDNFAPWTAFVSVGGFSQQDTVLAVHRPQSSSKDERFFYRVENSSGVCFGGGVLYDINEMSSIGLGYHTKRGVFARFDYFWF